MNFKNIIVEDHNIASANMGIKINKSTEKNKSQLVINLSQSSPGFYNFFLISPTLISDLQFVVWKTKSSQEEENH